MEDVLFVAGDGGVLRPRRRLRAVLRPHDRRRRGARRDRRRRQSTTPSGSALAVAAARRTWSSPSCSPSGSDVPRPRLVQLGAARRSCWRSSSPILGRYLAAVYGDPDHEGAPAAGARRPGLRPDRAAALPGLRRRRDAGAALERLRHVAARLQRRARCWLLYGLQRLQDVLPLNPNDVVGVEPSLAWNTAVSFTTNTNWQSYGGEYANGVSHLVQMLGLTVQNFVSAAVGAAVVVALDPGDRPTPQAHARQLLGRPHPDHHPRAPAAVARARRALRRPGRDPEPRRLHARSRPLEGATQAIPGGPVAGQEAIKQLGTNGGGFFNTNAAHPFENPDARHEPAVDVGAAGDPLRLPVRLRADGQGQAAGPRAAGGDGRAVADHVAARQLRRDGRQPGARRARRRPVGERRRSRAATSRARRSGSPPVCGLYAASTTGTSTGAVNCMHDSMTPARRRHRRW